MGRDERWFRLHFEAAADQGAAEAPAEGVDERYAWPEGTDPEIAGRYKDPVELARAKREQDATITRATQEAAEARRELEEFRAQQAEAQANQPWQDPLATALPQMLDENTAKRLDGLYQRDPAQAYEMALEAIPGYGPQIASRVLAAWMQDDPEAALAYKMNAMMSTAMDERFQSFEDALVERLGPTVAHATMSMMETGVALARKDASDFQETYEKRVDELLDAEKGGNPALIADVMNDPRAMADRLLQLRDLLWAQDERQRQAAAGQVPTATPADAPTAKPRQATIGNGSAPRPSSDDDARIALMRENMKNVRAATIPGE